MVIILRPLLRKTTETKWETAAKPAYRSRQQPGQHNVLRSSPQSIHLASPKADYIGH